MKKRKKRTAYYVGLMFGVIVLAFSLINVFSGTKKVSETENRALAQRPKLSVDSVLSGQYASEYQEFFNDQFVLRDAWIKLKTGFDRALGVVEENGVYLGKDGYLLEKFEKPDQKNVSATVEAMKTFREKHEDIPHYAMIIPSAENILKDKLPALVPSVNQDSYLDNTFQELSKSGINVVDVRTALKKNKDQKIYYQTDHHWTTYGAYVAFQQFAEAAGLDASAVTYEKLPVTDQFQGTLSAKSGFRTGEKEEVDVYLPKRNTNTTQEQLSSVIEYTDNQKKTGSFYNTDKLDQRNAYEVFFGGNHGLMKIKTPTTENKRLLVMKDSYANCFLPFLAPYYREIVVVDPRYYYGNIEELMETEGITEVLYLYSAPTFFSDTSLSVAME